jgi:NADH-quinone oxidoreductase subunit A
VAEYQPVIIYLGLIVAFAVVSLAAARLLGPRRPFAAKLASYECGAEPIGDAWVQFLAVFLFPWALALRSLGAWGIITMLMFVSILLLGWIYAYRERILEWK